jgi:hypothetical protein
MLRANVISWRGKDAAPDMHDAGLGNSTICASLCWHVQRQPAHLFVTCRPQTRWARLCAQRFDVPDKLRRKAENWLAISKDENHNAHIKGMIAQGNVRALDALVGTRLAFGALQISKASVVTPNLTPLTHTIAPASYAQQETNMLY